MVFRLVGGMRGSRAWKILIQTRLMSTVNPLGCLPAVSFS